MKSNSLLRIKFVASFSFVQANLANSFIPTTRQLFAYFFLLDAMTVCARSSRFIFNALLFLHKLTQNCAVYFFGKLDCIINKTDVATPFRPPHPVTKDNSSLVRNCPQVNEQTVGGRFWGNSNIDCGWNGAARGIYL